MKHLAIVATVAAVFACAFADCPYPGTITPCSQVDMDEYQDSGTHATWSCCNQNYVCHGCQYNPGAYFTKWAEIWYTKEGQGCVDLNNITNHYPTPEICCGC